MYPPMNAETLQALTKLASLSVTQTKEFEDVLMIYEKYFDVGCKYLLENKDFVGSLLKEFNLHGAILLSPGNPNFLFEYSAKHPERLVTLNQVFSCFMDRRNTIVVMLLKFSDQIIPLLEGNFKDTSNESPKSKSKSKPIECPKINSLDDIVPCGTLTQLSNWVKEHPFDDKIFFLGPQIEREGAEKSYISGSKGLSLFYNKLVEFSKQKDILLSKKNIDSNDTDIFFVGAKNVSRVKMDTVDLVYTRLESIQEVLLNFDLPCCRVAVDSNGNFYVSAQCLLALTLGEEVIMPEYARQAGTLTLKYNEARCRSIYIDSYIAKLSARADKYRARGFVFKYIKTDKMMNFI